MKKKNEIYNAAAINLTHRRKKQVLHGVVSFARMFFLLALAYIILYQMFYMISQALMPEELIYDSSVVWIPKYITLDNIKLAFKEMNYLKSAWTTVYILIFSGIIEVFVCAVIGYGFARFNFKERNAVFVLVLLTILVPPQMIVIPSYLNFTHLDFFGILGVFNKLTGIDLRPNVVNSAWTFWLPSLFGVGLRSGLFIFIYRQFFKGMPKELEEAAYIDGAGPFRTFISVILPSAGVAILTVLIFSLIWHWNEYYQSAIYLNENYPLAVALSQVDLGIQNGDFDGVARTLRMAGCTLFVLPMIIMYGIAQKWFIQSIYKVGIVG